MASYTAPLRDMRFVLEELLADEGIRDLPGAEDLTPDLIEAVLGEAAKFCEAVVAPLNQSGDEEGCRYENGAVHTPAGFPEGVPARDRSLRSGG